LNLIAMDIVKEFVKAKRPCAEGFRWFLRHYQNGSDYQPLLDALVAAGRSDDACWLLDQFGPTDAVLTLDDLETEAVVFAGTLDVRGHIHVDSILRAGRSIKAGGGIHAGRTIIAGEDLRSAGSIRCGGLVRVGGDMMAGWGINVDGPIQCAGDLRSEWELICDGPLSVEENVIVGHDLVSKAAVQCGKSIRVGGSITVLDSLRVEQGIECGDSILCHHHVEANWGAKAGKTIRAGGSIKAGESLQAGEDIQAGDGFGVYAGLVVRTDAWEASARVHAKLKPERLMSGWWAGPSPC
jgi:predicted acyltransferase (DUF342 family)